VAGGNRVQRSPALPRWVTRHRFVASQRSLVNRESASLADHRRIAIEVLLHEFDAHKAEIRARVTLQFQILVFSFAVIGSDVALVYQAHASTIFLLLIPIFGGLLGLIWVENDRIILLLGSYLRTELFERLQASAGGAASLPNWEITWRTASRDRFAAAAGAIPPLLIFIIPAILAELITALNLPWTPLNSLLLAGCVCFTVSVVPIALVVEWRIRHLPE